MVYIYLNELDKHAKHNLKIKCYVRYCDDFVIVMVGTTLGLSLQEIEKFLFQNLKLKLHPDKTIVRKPNQGIDFLGYIVFPCYKLLRTKTKKRIFKKLKAKRILLNQKKITKESFSQSLQSYLGALKHCKGYKIKEKVKTII